MATLPGGNYHHKGTICLYFICMYCLCIVYCSGILGADGDWRSDLAGSQRDAPRVYSLLCCRHGGLRGTAGAQSQDAVEARKRRSRGMHGLIS